MSFIPISYNQDLPTILCIDGEILQRAIAIFTLPPDSWEIVAYKSSDRVVVRNIVTQQVQMCKVVYNLISSEWLPTSDFNVSKSSIVAELLPDSQRAEIVYDLNDPIGIWSPTTIYTSEKSSTVFTDGTNFQRAEFVYDLNSASEYNLDDYDEEDYY